MSKVYVIQEQPKHNLSPALKFGDIITLLPPGDHNFSAQSVYEDLADRLKEFDCQNDWLLLTGDPVAIGLATAIAACYSLKDKTNTVRFLKWDRQEARYIPITVNLD